MCDTQPWTLKLAQVLKELTSGFNNSIKTNQLCRICRSLDFRISSKTKGSLTKEIVELGSVHDIVARRSCPFCQLVLHLVHGALVNEDAAHGSAPKGCKAVGCRQNVTQCELRLSGNVFEVWDSYGLQGYIHESNAIELPVEAEPGLEFLDMSFGRQLKLDLMQAWIRECELMHVACGIADLAASRQRVIDLLLVDVHQNRIVDADSRHKYVALSYVWGGVRMLQTSKSKLEELRKEGALVRLRGQIPRAILDAMSLTMLLNERYLWVDSLCIVQDDAASKHDQIKKMNIVYGQAFLTIISMSGTDANARLPGLDFHSRRPLIPSINISGLRYLARPLSIRYLLPRSPYEQRAWTYQERILSRRCLILTSHQVYFHCQSVLRSDVSDTMQDENTNQDILLNPLTAIRTQSRLSTSKIGGLWKTGGLVLYNELVCSYTVRHLSYPSDVLNAFAGIEAVMAEYFGYRFISGLPEDVFDIGLLWIKLDRENQLESIDKDRASERNLNFPSWSWTGRSGATGYLDGPTKHILKTGSPLVAKIDSFILHKNNKFEVIQRRNGGCLQLQHVERALQEHPCSQSHPPFDQEVLCFQADTVSLEQFRIVEAEWNSSQVLFYDLGNYCCGRLWIDEIGKSLDPIGKKCELVLMSMTNVGNVSTHLQLGYHFDSNRFRECGQCLVNVMLVEWGKNYAQRLAVGQIYLQAWNCVSAVRKGIFLA